MTGKHFLTDVLAGAWLGWEIARLMWSLGMARSIDALLPVRSWYPPWNWETTQPLADVASHAHGGDLHGDVFSWV